MMCPDSLKTSNSQAFHVLFQTKNWNDLFKIVKKEHITMNHLNFGSHYAHLDTIL